MRGQSAIEYLLILAAMLLALTAVIYPHLIVPASNIADDTLHLSQARTAVQTIASAINTVYSNGSGAVTSASFQRDRTWDLRLDNAENKVILTVGTALARENLEEAILCHFRGSYSILGIVPGMYTVIVDWSESQASPENVYPGPIENKKIYVRINPTGGAAP